MALVDYLEYYDKQTGIEGVFASHETAHRQLQRSPVAQPGLLIDKHEPQLLGLTEPIPEHPLPQKSSREPGSAQVQQQGAAELKAAAADARAAEFGQNADGQP